MHPILFQIGPLTIYTYGAMIFLGAVSSYFYSLKTVNRYGLTKEFVSDLFFWCVLCGFIGARLLYILLDLPGFFADPGAYIFTSAGFVFFGGIMGGTGALLWFSKKHRQNILDVCDLGAPAITLAHAFGRIGCFFYGCCYGKDWLIIPAQLIESAGLFLLFGFLAKFSARRPFKGAVVCAYLIIYGIMRFTVEFLRDDPRGFLGVFSTSQWLSIVAVFVGAALLTKLIFKKGT